MDFFNGLSKTLSDAAKIVEEKSGEFLEAGRLNIEIFKEEDAVRRSYRKIGELVYKAFEKGESYEGKAEELCSDIQERKKKIGQLKAKLSEAGKAQESPEGQQGERDSSEEKQEESPKEPEISYFEAVEKMNEMRDSGSSGSEL
jgi:peptidoglycan hydrolase CwlO-like protein